MLNIVDKFIFKTPRRQKHVSLDIVSKNMNKILDLFFEHHLFGFISQCFCESENNLIESRFAFADMTIFY